MAASHLFRYVLVILAYTLIIAIAKPHFSPFQHALDLAATLPSPSLRHHERPRPGSASIRGRRPYQEDRLVCAPRIEIPFYNKSQSNLKVASLFGVFDGHGGKEASDFLASSIRQQFLHCVYELFARTSPMMYASESTWLETSTCLAYSNISTAETFLYRNVLEDALRQSIMDLDSAFQMKAARQGLKSGSTACVTLLVDDQLLVANVGDSKALICSSCGRDTDAEKSDEHLIDATPKRYAIRSKKRQQVVPTRKWESMRHGRTCAKELSFDHRPDRLDERQRIEATGGFVTHGSLSRVNGQLAVSRSIGDIDFKRFGVISEPELSSWHHISENETFLVLASDGIFEALTPQEVCNVLHAVESGQDITAVMGGLNGYPFLGALPLPGHLSPEPYASVLRDEPRFGAEFTGSAVDNAAMDACVIGEASQDSGDMLATAFSTSAAHMGQIMARILVEIAYLAGSMDNLSALVVPLKHIAADYP